MTDPLNNVTVLYSDHDGRRVQTTDAEGGVTLLAYDALGQLVSATDPEGFTTAYTYDRLGRLTSRVHPDAGATQYTYDPAGNLRTEKNPLGEIFYYYRYQRLVKKRYGNIMGNNVTYTYGTSGTGRGRIVHVSDGTGEREMAYDQLGNVVREERIVAVPGPGNVYNFTTLYEYDSWGRMLSMTYPDGETVTYTYLYGGDLFSMRGIKGNATYSYVDRIEYNDFGQRSHMEYGNGTTTNYQYDAMHRLSSLTSVSASGTMQQIQYTLDGVGNIGTVQNTAAAVAGLGGTYTVQHSYDALDRLVNSSCVGSVASYTQNFTYSSSGRLDSKETVAGESGSLCYAYCDNFQPHAPRRILEQNNMTLYDLMWDAAGNLGQVNMAHGTDCLDSRFLFWTEDSRLHTVADSRFYSYYAYDHAGERTLKLTGDNSVLDVNAETMMSSSVLTNLTMYPSPYMVLSKSGYTKHYYIGSDRLCARIGGGGLEEPEPNSTLSNIASELFNECHNITNLRELNGNNLNCIRGHDCDEELLLQPMSDSPQSLDAVVTVWIRDFKEMVEYYSSNTDPEDDVFFYHSDHLGGANWITDADGYPVQHLQYMPFGESLLNQRVSGYSERFTFTGKEKDSESGYYYFGARYLDQDMTTLFLSVDPMADKYPSINPYAYCMWNPIKLVDPNGREIDDYFSYDGKYLGRDNASTNNVRIIDEKVWNSLKKDSEGRIDHNVGNIVSRSFSDAFKKGMPENALLNVYQHYNPTHYPVEKCKENDNTSNNPGMAITVKPYRKGALEIHLYVKLRQNSIQYESGMALCDNANEIINCFIHESNHIERALKMGYKKWRKMNNTPSGKRDIEHSAIASQRAHSSWQGCSEHFKKGVENYERQF